MGEDRTLTKKEEGAFLGLNQNDRALYLSVPSVISFMPHSSFLLGSTQDNLFGEKAEAIAMPDWIPFPEIKEDADGRERLDILRKCQTFTPREEAILFLRYNYARYRLGQLIEARENRRRGSISLEQMNMMVLWHGRVLNLRAQLVRGNLGLVLYLTKRTRIPHVEITELISDGNIALLRSIEKFDIARGFKFSTYACRAILKAFNRLATKTGRYQSRFPVSFDSDLEQPSDESSMSSESWEDALDLMKNVIANNKAHLNEVEKEIIIERFRLPGFKGSSKTLVEVGKTVGLTAERVRQIQNAALQKIREALDYELYRERKGGPKVMTQALATGIGSIADTASIVSQNAPEAPVSPPKEVVGQTVLAPPPAEPADSQVVAQPIKQKRDYKKRVQKVDVIAEKVAISLPTAGDDDVERIAGKVEQLKNLLSVWKKYLKLTKKRNALDARIARISGE